MKMRYVALILFVLLFAIITITYHYSNPTPGLTLTPDPALTREPTLSPEPALTTELTPSPEPALTTEPTPSPEPALTTEPTLNPVPVTLNMFAYTQQFNNAVWNARLYDTSVTADLTTSPDGTMTADMLNETVETGNHMIGQVPAIPVVGGLNYTLSFYLKKATTTESMQVTFGSSHFGSEQYADYTITSGIITKISGGTGTISDAGNGWYRVAFTAKAKTSGTCGGYSIFINNNVLSARTPSYRGDTMSAVYIWGAQYEQGDSVSVYKATSIPDSTPMPEPDYLNQNATSVPWIHQGGTLQCSAYSVLNAYDVTHGITGPLPYNVSDIYDTFRNLNKGNNFNYTALAKTSLQYGFNHYTILNGNNSVKWNKIKENTRSSGAVILLINTYANQYPETDIGFLYPEPPPANRVSGHYVTVVGYNDTLDQVFFLDSREESYQAGYKIRGITKNYWMKAGVAAFVPS